MHVWVSMQMQMQMFCFFSRFEFAFPDSRERKKEEEILGHYFGSSSFLFVRFSFIVLCSWALSSCGNVVYA